MTLDQALYGRRSVRRYNITPVPEEEIFKIVNAAMLAPSACNKQAWRFLYLDNYGQIKKLSDNGTAHFIKEGVCQAILVMYDNRIDNVEYHDNLQSAAAAIENMLLKAYDLGISTCWICNLPRKGRLRKLFAIPRWYDPVALVTLGYSDMPVRNMPRKYTVEEVLHRNIFDLEKDKTTEQQPGVKITIRRFFRRIYLYLPKTKFIYKFVDRFEKKFEN